MTQLAAPADRAPGKIAVYTPGQKLRHYGKSSGGYNTVTYVGPQASDDAHLVEGPYGRSGAYTSELSPLGDARLELSSATFFYGRASYDITASVRDLFPGELAPEWALLKGQTLLSATEGALRSKVQVLAEAIFRLSGDTLPPAEVLRRGSWRVLDMRRVFAAAGVGVEKLPAALRDFPVKLTFCGSGFNFTWNVVDVDALDILPVEPAVTA